MTDSITDHIRETRRSLAAQFGNDLDLILEDIRRRESSDGRRYVTLTPRPAEIRSDEPSNERADWKWFDDERG